MASSKVMASSRSRNSDLSRRSSSTASSSKPSDLNNNNRNNHHFDSMTVDGLLRNVYAGTPSSETTLLNAEITLLDSSATTAGAEVETNNSSSIPRQESFSNVHKTVDDVWKEIVAGGARKECKEEAPDSEMMTLEDFLARAGASVEDEEDDEVKMPLPLPLTDAEMVTERLSGGVFAFDPIPSSPFQATRPVEGSVIGFGNGVEVIGGGRGKKRATVVLEPLDKAAQQRQRRMIKNRESAARSRERKQAYQVELESLAVKLEEENERLLKEKAERTKERFKLLVY